MSKMKTLMGIIILILGIALTFSDIHAIVAAIFLICLGAGLIIFRKDESTIEQRKDKFKSKAKGLV